MDENLPQWLNHEFLAAALQGGENTEPKVIIIKFNTTPAVQAGSNYSGTLYRVKVEYKQEDKIEHHTKSLIVKTPPVKGIIKEFSEEKNLTDLELFIYNTVLPKMYSLYAQDQITPVLFYSIKPEILILEDLNEQGYMMMDRLNQLDYSHCVAAVRSIAKFHAMSIIVHNRWPELIQNLNQGIVYKNNVSYRNKYSIFLTTTFNGLANAVETWEGYEHFGEKIRKLIDIFWEKMTLVFLPRNDFNVLNHGDCWSNNILFKHDESGNVIDSKLLDFQVCSFGTPAIDLQYFTWSSVNEDVRKNKLHEVYMVYLETLNSTLESLGFEGKLSADQLYNELKSTEIYGFVTFCEVLPFTLSDPDNLVQLHECTRESLQSYDINVNPTLKNYYGQYYKKVATGILLDFEEKGFFKDL